MKKRISVLGASGSVGAQALDVAKKCKNTNNIKFQGQYIFRNILSLILLENI